MQDLDKRLLEFVEVVPDPHDGEVVRYTFRAPPHSGVQPDNFTIKLNIPYPRIKGDVERHHKSAYALAFARYVEWTKEVDSQAKVEEKGIEATLKQRGNVHGDFPLQALMHDQLLRVMMTSPIFKKLNAPHRQSLNLITMKISRILNGDPHHTDHWHDISGYATLAEKACVAKDPNQAELPL